jgi:hypothetical protein
MSPADALAALPADEFAEIVRADLRGALDEPYRTALRAVPDLWRDALVREKTVVEARLAVLATTAASRKRACHAMGPRGKAAWIEFRASAGETRKVLTTTLAVLESRLVEARRVLREQHAAREAQRAARDRALLPVVKMIAHYPTDRDPACLGTPDAKAAFFQQAARDALALYATGDANDATKEAIKG